MRVLHPYLWNIQKNKHSKSTNFYRAKFGEHDTVYLGMTQSSQLLLVSLS